MIGDSASPQQLASVSHPGWNLPAIELHMVNLMQFALLRLCLRVNCVGSDTFRQPVLPRNSS